MAKINGQLSANGNDDGWEMPCLEGAPICGAAPFFNNVGQLIGYTVSVGMNDDDATNRDIIIDAVNAAGRQWQKIESAPRDGSTIMLWSDAWAFTWGELQVGHYEGDGEGGGQWVTVEGAVEDNDPDYDPKAEPDMEDVIDNLDDHNFGPTHWMPLIPGPTA